MASDTITPLQYMVLGVISGAKSKPGAEIREKLRENGYWQSGPAFYQLMKRLEENDLVEGWYEEDMLDGERIRKRCYRLNGDAARAAIRAFERRSEKPVTTQRPVWGLA